MVLNMVDNPWLNGVQIYLLSKSIQFLPFLNLSFSFGENSRDLAIIPISVAFSA